MASDPLSELRLSDVLTFLSVKRLRSMAAAARESNVTPSQVTKAIARLESQLGVELVTRTGRGIALNEAAEQLAPQLEDLVEKLRAVRHLEREAGPRLTLAAPSFLYSLFLPRLANIQGLRVRGFELPRTLIRALAAENTFDMALLVEASQMPANWVSALVGRLRSGLFTSRRMAQLLGPQPVSADALREHAFVGPLYFANGQLLRGDDGCPLPMSERRIGHEAQTILVALELGARSDQLVFGPAVTARTLLATGALVEVAVEGWNVSSPLYLVCNGDRVRSRVQQAIIEQVKQGVSELELSGVASSQ
jgi:DNA-binding transcriptional LysR family regulator